MRETATAGTIQSGKPKVRYTTLNQLGVLFVFGFVSEHIIQKVPSESHQFQVPEQHQPCANCCCLLNTESSNEGPEIHLFVRGTIRVSVYIIHPVNVFSAAGPQTHIGWL